MGNAPSRPDEPSVAPRSSPQTRRSASPTSTDEYEDHEPFETFQGKVRELCLLLWPAYGRDDFRIERMKGGFSNRVIGIHVPERSPGISQRLVAAAWGLFSIASSAKDAEPRLPPGDYVLRIPRFQSAHLDYDKRILDLASTYTTVGVPRVVAMDDDPSATNPLGQPYILQRRLDGQRLDDVWEALNHQQRLCIAKDVAAFFVEVQKAPNQTGGLPDFERSGTSTQTVPTVDFEFVGDTKRPLESQHPADMLCARLLRWDKKYAALGFTDRPWLGLVEMVKSMQTSNKTFGSDTPTYYFHHGDLFPRNIMVNIVDDETAAVTGILDWDEAHFAPAVIALASAAWLWVEEYWNENTEEYIPEEAISARAQETPRNEEGKELKAVFEEKVGPEFLKYAYAPDAYEARKIWSSAKESIGKSWVVDELSNMLADWRSGREGENAEQHS